MLALNAYLERPPSRYSLRRLVNASATCSANGLTPLARVTLAAAAAIVRPRSGNVRSETAPPMGLPR